MARRADRAARAEIGLARRLLNPPARRSHMIEIRFWGVRGSIASSGPGRQQVGGNTSCVEVRAGEQLIILDAGTGLRDLGVELMRRGGRVDATLLVSHLHWDHIQGFPFFAPAYSPESRLAIYGPRPELLDAFAAQMRPPHFPVGLDAMRAALDFHGVSPGVRFALGDVEVRTAAARHPGGCLAWRLDHGGRSLVYATDTEHGGDGALDRELVELARGADVLIYDAQYTPAEYAHKRGWGHSTAEEGARLAAAAAVGRLILFHHDPSHDDWEIARIEAATRARFPMTWAAREGMEVALDGSVQQAA
jgi:phosphoribosyl 1,2-cyclic phosphodiesterase